MLALLAKTQGTPQEKVRPTGDLDHHRGVAGDLMAGSAVLLKDLLADLRIRLERDEAVAALRDKLLGLLIGRRQALHQLLEPILNVCDLRLLEADFEIAVLQQARRCLAGLDG